MKLILVIMILFISVGTLMAAQVDMGSHFNIIKIVTQVGDTVTIGLVSNRTTGYSWRIKEPYKKDILQLVNSEFVPGAAGLAGSGGKEVWNFKATAEGVTPLVFIYKRPWEEQKATDKIARFVIAIQASGATKE